MPSKSTCLFAILAFAATLSTVDAATVDADKFSEQEQPTSALNRPSKVDLPSLSVTNFPNPIGETRRPPKLSLSRPSLSVQVPSTDFSADPAAEPPKSVVSPRLKTIPMLSLGVPSTDTPVKQPLRMPFDFSAFNWNGDLSDSRPAATEITRPAATEIISDILKNPRRVVAVGDVHSDLNSFLAVLIRANLVKITEPAPVKASIWGENMPEWVLKQEEKVSDVQWAGREGDVLVQTGDMVDRGVDTIAVYTSSKTEGSSRKSRR